MKSFAKAKRRILNSHDVAIAGHVNPDGDCIGSLLALGLALENMGKRVHMLLQDPSPPRYNSLAGIDKIKKTMKGTPDLAVTVDCNTMEIVGKVFTKIGKAEYILEIDHHEYRKPFGNLRLIDTEAAAVGEIIYRLLKYLKTDITKEIAQNILTSIIVETNSFRLPGVRPFTFRICEKLLGTGVDYYNLSELVYWAKTKPMAILSGICMSRLRFLQNDKIAWSEVSKRDFSRAKGRDEDADTVANDILAINTVKIAILFREKNDSVLRVSLRSKAGINVASLAAEYDGGGHHDSAGCNISNNKSVKTEFIKKVQQLLK